MNVQENKKEFWMNQEWKITTYALISSLIYYGLFVTIAIITDLPSLIGLPYLFVPLFALVSAFLYFVVFRTVLLKAARRRTNRSA